MDAELDNFCNFLQLKLMSFSFSALDEGDIEILKTYVS